ncbi:TniB family NTP-binding protein [Paenibacillus sedimenti]|uniref:TniB family NTP-binding protein n=1 Tax=Paenibacillus sedimenti TaxID=2770274 RepID=A0A926KNI6_9BACL|nr:TniB family NTP-binding protein [Paenibacillus sedimenti]MBD0380985.1 TniB family NTP-binding protein [Paenibacillus sedimenti]
MDKNIKRLNGQRITDEELSDRLAVLDRIVVKHTRFNELHEAIRECHVLQSKSLNKKGLCILGDTGAGKSTLFKTYESFHPRETRVKKINNQTVTFPKVPVLRVELDSNSKPLNVASKMLEELGDPFHYKGTEKQLTTRLKGFIEDCEVELIIIDELQHLIDTDTQRVIRKAADWLKQLVNDVNLPIVFGGIKDDASRIFSSNKQLDERFPYKPSFPGFKYETEKEKKEFCTFLNSIEFKLPFPDNSELADPYLSEKLYYASLGIPRTLNHLLYHSTKIALKDGMDRIEERHLQEGFDQLSFETRPRVKNPFHGKVFDLRVAIASEKLTKSTK